MKTITTEDGQKVGISEESYAAMVDAAREPIGEALVRGLPLGKYRINGKRIDIKTMPSGNKGVYVVPNLNNFFSYIDSFDNVWYHHRDFERCINMYLGDLRQHHIKPYEVEWRDMTREEVLAFVLHYEGKILTSMSGNWDFCNGFSYINEIEDYAFAHIERDGAIGEAHKFRCTVDAPHKVEGTDYEF